MTCQYYFSRTEDPYFIELKQLLDPVTNDILSDKPLACQKAIRLMHTAIIKIPAIRFKDPEYTKLIVDAVESYLSFNDQLIKSIARKRRTDRLEVKKTIASDCLEYLSFLPIQLETDSGNIRRYVENMDNIFCLLRKIESKKNHFKQLRLQIEMMA